MSAACDPVFRPMDTLDSRRILTRVAFGVAAGFVLYTGGADRRKNLPRLVEAYAGLDAKLRAGMQLVFAGHMPAPHVDELKRLAASLGLAERDLVFTGYVSDEQLVALYNECSLFAFPSWHEGFGLPVLEAMACGAAVIASDASSILEIATEPTALFDPMDVDSLRARMAHFLSNPEENQRLRDYSLERAQAFSWDKVASVFVDACEHVVGLGLERSSPEAAINIATTRLGALPDAQRTDLLRAADALDRSCMAEPQLLVDVTELADRICARASSVSRVRWWPNGQNCRPQAIGCSWCGWIVVPASTSAPTCMQRRCWVCRSRPICRWCATRVTCSWGWI